MDKKEKEIRENLAEFVDQMEAIVNLAESESRDLTEEEETEYNDLEKKAGAEKKKLDRHLKLRANKDTIGEGAKEIDDEGKPKVEVKGNQAESKEAMIENVAKIYRAISASGMDMNNRSKLLQEAQRELADGGHYRSMGIMNAADDSFITVLESTGGVFLPTSISDEIMRIALEYGAFPANSLRFPLSPATGRIKVPNYLGSFTFYPVTETAEARASKTSFKAIVLDALKWMAFIPWSNEIDMAASSKLVPLINLKIAEGWAGVIDDAVISGDGTSDYHNKKGFINRSADAAAPEVSRATATTGNNTFAEITITDLLTAQLSVAPSVRMGGIYVFHPDWDVRLRLIKDANNLPLFLHSGDLTLSADGWRIGGKRVVFTEKMPNTDGASATYGLFYNPNYLAIGGADTFMAEMLTEAYILESDGTTRISLGGQDMKALRIKGFFDYEFSPLTVSSGGSTLGAFVLLRTAAT